MLNSEIFQNILKSLEKCWQSCILKIILFIWVFSLAFFYGIITFKPSFSIFFKNTIVSRMKRNFQKSQRLLSVFIIWLSFYLFNIFIHFFEISISTKYVLGQTVGPKIQMGCLFGKIFMIYYEITLDNVFDIFFLFTAIILSLKYLKKI